MLRGEYVNGEVKEFWRLWKQPAKQLFILLLFILSFSSINAQQSSIKNDTLTIVFHNTIGANDAHIDSSYANPFGEIFTVKKIKYYVSNILLVSKDKNQVQSFPEDYFLIDEEDNDSKIIKLVSTVGNITSIHFLIGVDSLRNVRGVQTGILDPAKGMFWVWNTGYIMAKLEGVSPAAIVPGHYFTYDIGGYKQGENTTREISLNIPYSPDTRANTVFINADISKWFNAVHDIRISDNPLCHMPGKLAVQIADNFANMFSIVPGIK